MQKAAPKRVALDPDNARVVEARLLVTKTSATRCGGKRSLLKAAADINGAFVV